MRSLNLTARFSPIENSGVLSGSSPLYEQRNATSRAAIEHGRVAEWQVLVSNLPRQLDGAIF
jgi:hypothetical protein